MYGFEFADKEKHHSFPEYNHDLAVKPESISSIAPLVWQEHCVECAMPACYGTCEHYKRRSDGRCRLFKYGIERFENPDAIFGQNVVIDMNEWGKLETFWFTSGMSYEQVEKINNRLVNISNVAQTLRIGKLRRLSYYGKEYYTRKIGDENTDIPHFFLCEIYGDDKPYTLNLENRAGNEIVYRSCLNVKGGYNRFLISVAELNYTEGVRNNLLLYPNGNEPQLINIISLELISFKEEYLEQYLPRSTKKVKCVVWDLDNTVWQGILGDDGIDGVRLKQEIVEIIRDLDAKGIVNSIASKNYEDKVIEALQYFGLYDLFVCPIINWSAKSNSIKTIVKTLDIGIDTFVFVDDSSFELNEVRENCPEIRVCNVEDVEEYVKSEYFDVPVTEESKHRRESYKEIAIRNKAEQESGEDILDFLRSCDMKVHVQKPNSSEINRCYELMQRTNQLNISAERLTLEQVQSVVNDEKYDCCRIKVDDRFGDYGLVGFAVFNISKRPTVVLEHFVFSCRAARKKIEQSFFEHIILKYRAMGYQELSLKCKRTEKNRLMQQVLEESGLFVISNDDGEHYILNHNFQTRFDPINVVTIIED